MVSLMGSYEIPKIAVQVSGNLTSVSGTAIASRRTSPACRRDANSQPAFAGFAVYRTPQRTVHARAVHEDHVPERPATLRADGRGEERAERAGHYVDSESQIFNNANFLVTNTFPEPRQLRLFARVFF